MARSAGAPVNISKILNSLPGLSVLVAGDICLDRWCSYDPSLSEPSRETGIPRLAVVSTESTPGAAGVVASNLAALGVGRVTVLGAVGVDGHALELIEALRRRGIDPSHLVREPTIPTFTYTKLINLKTGEEDQPRVDYVLARQPPASAESAVVSTFERLAPKADVIIVSDQAETDEGGIVTQALREAMTRVALAYPGKTIWVDSRKRGELYRRVLLKLNEQEANECCERIGGGDCQSLRRLIEHNTLIVTRGDKGALIYTEEGVRNVPARTVANPVDICGAGDAFNAGASVALALSGDPGLAVRMGNTVASVTIMKRGTGTASASEVLAATEKAVSG
jgi:rfaE bifunctional protein kinase chain/domain